MEMHFEISLGCLETDIVEINSDSEELPSLIQSSTLRTSGDHGLIIYHFTSRSRIFHLYGDVTITGKRLQNLGLCSALRAFEQGGIFIVPHLL
jgi:hypothetical protein